MIGLDVGEAETEAFWREFLRALRGPRPDRRPPLRLRLPTRACKAAIGQVLGCPWQRCTVHFLRDMLGHCAKSQQPMISAAIRGIFSRQLGPGGPRAPRRGRRAPRARRPEGRPAARWTPRTTCSASTRFPREHWTKLRSTNPLERVNREIGRRTDVVGIFPNDAALIRLAGALLVEQNDEWLVSRRYLSCESLALTGADHGPFGPAEAGQPALVGALAGLATRRRPSPPNPTDPTIRIYTT